MTEGLISSFPVSYIGSERSKLRVEMVNNRNTRTGIKGVDICPMLLLSTRWKYPNKTLNLLHFLQFMDSKSLRVIYNQ